MLQTSPTTYTTQANTSPHSTMAMSWNWPIWVGSAWVPSHHRLLFTCAHHAENIFWTVHFIKVISLLKEISEHRSPETLVSDNSPQYTSTTFAEFADEWKFTHTSSSPNHREGNGFAESMMKIAKQTMQHAKFSGCDPRLALLSYRCTPLDSHIASPAELLYQKCLQSTLPSHLRNTALHTNDTQEDPTATPTSLRLNMTTELHQSEPYSMLGRMSLSGIHRHLWLPAKVMHHTADWAYLIRAPAGSQYKCTQDHIKQHHIAAHPMADEPEPLEFPAPHTAVPHAPIAPAPMPTATPETPAVSDKPSTPLLEAATTAPATCQSSLPHQDMPSHHQQYLCPLHNSDALDTPSYHPSTWSLTSYAQTAVPDLDHPPTMTWLLLHAYNCDDVSCQPIDHKKATMTMCHAIPLITRRQPWWCVVPAHGHPWGCDVPAPRSSHISIW